MGSEALHNEALRKQIVSDRRSAMNVYRQLNKPLYQPFYVTDELPQDDMSLFPLTKNAYHKQQQQQQEPQQKSQQSHRQEHRPSRLEPFFTSNITHNINNDNIGPGKIPNRFNVRCKL